MISGGKSVGARPVTRAFLKTYVAARRRLCREPKATMITPRKSTCAKDLYGTLRKVWNELSKSSWQTRFFMAVPVLSKDVEAICTQYAMKSRSTRAAKKAYLSCTIASIRGRTSWLQKQFKKVGLPKLQPHLTIWLVNGKKHALAFIGALGILSAPSCNNFREFVNTRSLYPLCDRPAGGSKIPCAWDLCWRLW